VDRGLRERSEPVISGPDTHAGSDLVFQQLMDNLPAGAYLCDPDGLITYYNQCAKEVWGRSPQLNDAIDRYCGSFRLYATDGTPLDHRECWMALALRRKRHRPGDDPANQPEA
jgi:PAS domain-containing protein